MRTKNIHIQHAENGREYQIENFSIDRYDEAYQLKPRVPPFSTPLMIRICIC